MTKVILFNGPPRSGKDTAADTAVELLGRRALKMKFADAVKAGTHVSYGISDVRPDYFELVKDEPCEDFFGLTPRQAYIHHSETYMKPLHGQDVFGRIMVKRMQSMPAEIAVVSDSGFIAEAKPVIDLVGAENVFLVRIHRVGCDFRNDSRSYIELKGVTTLDLKNDRRECFRYSAFGEVMEWLNLPKDPPTVDYFFVSTPTGTSRDWQ